MLSSDVLVTVMVVPVVPPEDLGFGEVPSGVAVGDLTLVVGVVVEVHVANNKQPKKTNNKRDFMFSHSFW